MGAVYGPIAIEVLKPFCRLHGAIAPSVLGMPEHPPPEKRGQAGLNSQGRQSPQLPSRSGHAPCQPPHRGPDERVHGMGAGVRDALNIRSPFRPRRRPSITQAKQHHRLRERGLGKRFLAEEMPKVQSRKSTGEQVLQSVWCDSS